MVTRQPKCVQWKRRGAERVTTLRQHLAEAARLDQAIQGNRKRLGYAL